MTKHISVGHGKYALVDDEDYHLVKDKTWHLTTWGYAQHTWREGGKRFNVSMHRLILGDSAGRVTDHIDRNPLNNQRANLRPCSHRENNLNRRAYAKSGYKGAYQSSRGGRWMSSILIDGKLKHLGTFDSAEEAGRAYDTVARQYHGEFARLNSPSDT